METTKKVDGQCKGGHGEENFISNDEVRHTVCMVHGPVSL